MAWKGGQGKSKIYLRIVHVIRIDSAVGLCPLYNVNARRLQMLRGVGKIKSRYRFNVQAIRLLVFGVKTYAKALLLYVFFILFSI